ncbi:tRNA dimethylallyltransferase [Nostocoides japonicum T1-X7]|uniref:tRNA dimethylallyltransferase n=1 Tax=Nostocoides japonicum T1-X7 TaxID=1194083 RepID=A0A077M407_9MICO|nr:tRNA (adenosine(37)-N6)-dimethylallyltransferase MiaA [Tetrasphaera japonica]CCH78904.1 tRNA dimethylallyltransferase [Tetrasphaera japonica T1-X7]
MTHPVVAVVGPTATGKSGLGVDLALALDGEIVNADAFQLYRGMDIGTAKLPEADRRGIPHHQLDILDVSEEASLAAYQSAARADIAAVRARGRTPVVVGGSGLYVRAALDRLDIPPADPDVRARLVAELARDGVDALRERLGRLDPVAAQAIEPRNGRRIVRALEVVELTGRPFSATMPTREHLLPTVTIGLRMPRETLDERVASRVRTMWRAGLLDEVRALEGHGLREGRTATKAVGYAQALAQLDGVLTADEAQEETAARTRRLVRRQESWFGADPRVHWLDAGRPDLLERALAAVERAVDGITAGLGENG